MARRRNSSSSGSSSRRGAKSSASKPKGGTKAAAKGSGGRRGGSRRSSKPARGGGGSGEPRFTFRTLGRGLGVAAWILVPILLAVGWGRGGPRLAEHVRASTDVPVEVVFPQGLAAVRMLEDDLVAEALAAARAPMRSAVAGLDTGGAAGYRGITRRVREAMLATGWFDPEQLVVRLDLVAVEPIEEESDPGLRRRIEIDGPCRTPAAMVRHGAYDYVIDAEAVRLQPQYTPGQVDSLIAIIRADPRGVPEIGRAWTDPGVRDGLDLIRYLESRDPPWLEDVAAVGVSNHDGRHRYGGRPRLVLVSDDGLEIGWGRAVGTEAGIELPADEKIRMITADYEERGRLGHEQGLLMVNTSPATLDR